MKTSLIKIASTIWIQHLIFWVLSVIFITLFFAISNEYATTDLIYSLCFHGCLVPLVYLQLRWAIPALFVKERYFLLILATAINVGVALVMHRLIFDLVIPRLLSDFFIVSFTESSILVIIFSSYAILTSLFHLSKSWFLVNSLENDKIILELKSLKNQLNPHFLFNGLNSIYSLSIQQNPKASEAILKLSDLLRYSIYEINADTVPLKKEAEMIRNYIDLQLLRFRPSCDVQFDCSICDESSIIPMMLLPILENAFKHGNLAEKGAFIHLKLSCNTAQLTYLCINTYHGNADYSDTHSGIGLDSISKLIHLYYGSQGKLTTQSGNGTFTTTLNLTLT